ncbi:MAG: hypothetical protein ACN6RG_13015 [Stenotrophomonas sp.]
MKKAWGLVLVLLLSACGAGLDGTYADALGMATYTFGRDGKVAIKVMGQSQETTYVRDKDTLRIAVPGQPDATLELVVNADGSLQGPMGMRLAKVED